MRKLTLLLCLLASAAVMAQDQPKDQAAAQPNPFSAFNKFAYSRMQETLLRSAEKMPEENYNFKPADAVRTFGQLVGHVADAQYYFCSTATGEKNPGLNIEKTKTSKADLVAALKESIAFCNKAYEGMTDARGAETVKLFANLDAPRLGVLEVNLVHDNEHYGNMVTYMRLKNIVPPTSEQQAQPPAAPKK